MDALRHLLPGRDRAQFVRLTETELTVRDISSPRTERSQPTKSVSFNDEHTVIQEHVDDDTGRLIHVSQQAVRTPPEIVSSLTFRKPRTLFYLCATALCCLFGIMMLGMTIMYLTLRIKYPDIVNPHEYQCPLELLEQNPGEDDQAGCTLKSNSTGDGYFLSADFSGKKFLDNWNFFSENDPTHGTVNYLTREAAEAANLTYFDETGDLFYLMADASNIIASDARGRDSIRLESKKSFKKGLVVIDAPHIPTGCGTWPAFWMYEDPWPDMGEIDIIEGVHDSTANAAALHTSPDCSMAGVTSNTFQGHWNLGTDGTPANDCYILAEGQGVNQGCSIGFPQKTLGRPWNNGRGGIYAMLWDESAIRIWVFSRECVPHDLKCGSPLPESWGLPIASFPLGNDCEQRHFSSLKLVINLTFCGDWAGSAFSWNLASKCRLKGPSCDQYVRQHPTAFSEAFWALRYVRVYQKLSDLSNK